MTEWRRFDHGGYVPNGETWAVIHPEECIIDRDLKCVRGGEHRALRHGTTETDGKL